MAASKQQDKRLNQRLSCTLSAAYTLQGAVDHSVERGLYSVTNMSICGASILGSKALPLEAMVGLIIEIPNQYGIIEHIAVAASVRYCKPSSGNDGLYYLGVNFVNSTIQIKRKIASFIFRNLLSSDDLKHLTKE